MSVTKRTIPKVMKIIFRNLTNYTIAFPNAIRLNTKSIPPDRSIVLPCLHEIFESTWPKGYDKKQYKEKT